jgi:hypothetical protein
MGLSERRALNGKERKKERKKERVKTHTHTHTHTNSTLTAVCVFFSL